MSEKIPNEIMREAEMLDALRLCQRTLAMLTAPDAIRSTTVHSAWAQAVEAELKARNAILSYDEAQK